MNWVKILGSGPPASTQLRQWLPDLDEGAATRIATDPETFLLEFASACALTEAEALETLEDYAFIVALQTEKAEAA